MALVDAPLVGGGVVGAVGLRDDALEVLERQTVEGKVEDVAPAVGRLAQVGEPGAVVAAAAARAAIWLLRAMLQRASARRSARSQPPCLQTA